MNKEFPTIGLGTWEITGENVFPAINAAINAGYKHIDTAQIYNNESQIGDALEKLNANNGEIFITSKVWPLNYKKHTRSSLLESLRRLKVKKIDLMLLHAPLPKERYDDVIIAYKELMKAREEGLIGNVGVSNFPIDLLKYIKEKTGEFPFNNQIVLAPTTILEDVEVFCKENNISLTGYSTLRAYFNPNVWYEGSGFNETQKTRVEEMAAKYSKNIGQFLSRWALQNGYHIIPKSNKEERITTNIQINDFEIDKTDIDELRTWNKYTTEKMFDNFSNQLENLGSPYEEITEKGLLFDKNFTKIL